MFLLASLSSFPHPPRPPRAVFKAFTLNLSSRSTTPACLPACLLRARPPVLHVLLTAGCSNQTSNSEARCSAAASVPVLLRCLLFHPGFIYSWPNYFHVWSFRGMYGPRSFFSCFVLRRCHASPGLLLLLAHGAGDRDFGCKMDGCLPATS